MRALQAFMRAYSSLSLNPDDFQIPERIAEERLLPEHEGVVEELRERLEKTGRVNDFENKVFSTASLIHGRHMEQMEYLKKQIVLNELRTELNTVSDMLHSLKKKGLISKDAESVFEKKIMKINDKLKGP